MYVCICFFFLIRFFEGDIGFPRTRGCLGHHVAKHVKAGAVDGPSEAVLKQVQVYIYIYIYYGCLCRRRKGTLNMHTRRQLQEQ